MFEKLNTKHNTQLLFGKAHTWGGPQTLSKAEITYVIKLHRKEREKIVAMSFNPLKHSSSYSVNTQIPSIRSLMYNFDTIRSLKYKVHG